MKKHNKIIFSLYIIVTIIFLSHNWVHSHKKFEKVAAQLEEHVEHYEDLVKRYNDLVLEKEELISKNLLLADENIGLINVIETLKERIKELEAIKILSMEATAYTDDVASQGKWVGQTASGLKPQVGVVAVDPRVIPLGTKLYIEGYGEAIAGDTGGAIKGHKIDLFFNSRGRSRDLSHV